MTDREIMQMALEALDSKHDMTKAEWRVLQYHAFTALRAALAQPEQEPVAWITTWNEPNDAGVELHWAKQDKGLSSKYTPLYTAPLQQPEQEPVAWMWDVYSGAGYTSRGIDFYPTNIPFAKHTPLYTASPQREFIGLTDDELVAAWDSTEPYFDQADFAKAIEAKLKEKNT